MSAEEFNRILRDIGAKGEDSTQKEYTFQGFDNTTFDILKKLARNTSYEAVKPLSDDIHKHVVHPLRDLLCDIAQDFDTRDILNLEMRKHVMSHLWKANPRLGAWPHIWGAFYQKSETRTESMQLFVSLTADYLTYGIYPSDKNREIRLRLEKNYEKYGEQLQEYLPTDFYQRYFFYADNDADRYRNKKTGKDYSDLLRYFKEHKLNIGCILTPDDAVRKGPSLVQEIRGAFEDLIPLYVCGITEDPIGVLESYYKSDYDRTIDAPLVSEEYSIAQCMYDTGFDEVTIARWMRAIERKGQVIFYGPPGTGKTFVAEKLAKHVVSGGDGFIEFVQFHPAYSYEDFMQGIRPKSTAEGRLDYPVVPGRFLEFIRRAQTCKDCCVLIIDEINRANLARVFGELMYLLEYRDRKMHLAAGGTIRIPENVRIIGTMNTADRSIALVDHALRRRFAFLALYPQYDVLRKYHAETDFPVENLVEVLEQLNKAIDDKHYAVGITFFLKHDLENQIEDIWNMEIEPYLEEYFFDQPDKVVQFRWDKVKDEIFE
jgi:5-methylcytosine-specific restriction protein B